MPFTLVVLALLWILFCVLHSALASTSLKRRLQRGLGRGYRHYRLAYTLFAFATLIGIILYQINLSPLPFFRTDTFIRTAGVVVSACGLALMAVCIRKYFMGLSGLRSLFEERPKNRLIITGVHRFVRHPLYLGTFVFLWGLLLILPYWSLLISNTIITIYTVLGIHFEETKLIGEFGNDYNDYRRSVPMLIPRMGRPPRGSGA